MAYAYLIKHREDLEKPVRDVVAECRSGFPRAYTGKGLKVDLLKRPQAFVISSRNIGGRRTYRLAYYFTVTGFERRNDPVDRKGEFMFIGANDGSERYFGDGLTIDDADLNAWLADGKQGAVTIPDEQVERLLAVVREFDAK